MRIAPVFAAANEEETARQFNIEFRVADAAASPYLALGAVVFAGADGLRRQLELPQKETADALPRSLDEALARMADDPAVARWMGPVLFDAYQRFKRAEVKETQEDSPGELCARYAEVY